MSDIIKQYEKIALSDSEVLQLVKNKANIILYPNLVKYDNVDQILDLYGACFILFESRPNYGHWCCLFKVNNDTLEFFNPYGGYPDDSLEFINNEFRFQSNQAFPYLSYLLLKSNYNLTYNEHKFQQKKEGINTCGRWSALRIICRNMSLKQFNKFIENLSKKLKLNKDEIVTLLTIK